MILRRITEHVKAQNWTAVALDFVIVVVGVFIGIQVANWNAARADQQVAARHLSEIAEDLRTHLSMHDKLYGAAVARIAAVDLIYERAFDERLPAELTFSVETYSSPPTPKIPEAAHQNILGWVNLVRITVGARSGYESLISSGNLRLIQNTNLARSIQLYYGGYDDLLNTQELFRSFRNDGVRELYDLGVSAFDERPIEEIVALARENEKFAAYLRAMREWAILHANLLDGLETETRALLTEIEAELEKR